jgi:two-component system, OmpR family, sensor histidine kinase TctE
MNDDGGAKRPHMTGEQRSLFGEILDWMLAPLLLLWPMTLGLTWWVAQGVAGLPYDRELGIAVKALAQRVSGSGDAVSVQLSGDAARFLREDDTDTVYYQVLGTRGEFVSGDRDLPVPPLRAGACAADVCFREEELGGRSVRIAYQWVSLRPGGDAALVQVAETLGKRSRLATDILKAVVLPQFLILPLAVLLVWLALARGLAPLDALQRRIRGRASDDVSAIDEREAPEEVSPLVAAINDLLARERHYIQTQKRFIADAAHQLKTPLAGLRTQAELAQRELDAGRSDATALTTSLAASLHQMQRGSQHATRIVNQLLSMARADARSLESKREAVDLAELAPDVVREFVPRAMDKRIDLGYEGPVEPTNGGSTTQVQGNALLLRELLVNLVDNALQYTPAGGTITVRVVADPFGQVVVLQVEDTGAGIAPADRALVFQPFYRVLGTGVDGSGLGLAIVAEIARQHGAPISIDDTRAPAPGAADGGGPGARFTLRFAARHAPAPQPAAARAA